MQLVFLTEDKSGKELLRCIMGKYCLEHPNVTYEIYSFHGIGTIPKKLRVNGQKTSMLLNDLPAYLKGISKRLLAIGGQNAIVVVCDCDCHDCAEFKDALVKLLEKCEIETETVFCLAIEEMEAWLLGDPEAVLAAYPSSNLSELRSYRPDSIVGTWERLADITYKGGCRQMKKDCPTFYEIGAMKIEWAMKIGVRLNLHNNQSPSFSHLIKKLDMLTSEG
jgi:hypothetical protein